MRLKDKIALVTGSSQGIGRAIAVRFAQEGADVVINYNRTAKGAEEALAEVEAAGRRGLIVKADLSKVAEIGQLIDQGRQTFRAARYPGQQRGIGKACAFLGSDGRRL